MRVAKAGLVVHEVPSFERDRDLRESNLNAVRDGLRVLRTIGVERSSRSQRVRLSAGLRRLGID